MFFQVTPDHSTVLAPVPLIALHMLDLSSFHLKFFENNKRCTIFIACAAFTKYHKLGGSEKRNLFLTVMVAEKYKIKVQADLVLGWGRGERERDSERERENTCK